MADVRELRCTNCHAPLRAEMARAGVVTCQYCGTALRIPGLGGGVLAAADFRDPSIPGWTTGLTHQLQLLPGPPPELLARLEANPGSWNVLRSTATFDDFDVSVTIRLLWGDLTTTRAGLLLRRGDHGWYEVWISTQGTFSMLFSPPGDTPNKRLVSWTSQSALRREPGAPNEIRAVLQGDRLRVLLNGTQAAALRDDSASFGTIFLSAFSSVPMAVAYSSLVVREPERAGEAQAAPAEPQGSDGQFDLVLRTAANASSKIMAIKAVKETLGLGLKESKDLVEGTNQPLLLQQARARVDRLAKELRDLGCDVEIRRSR
jgi:ribosomal protein L7/L12